MDGGGLTDDDVYAAMAAATAHSQALTGSKASASSAGAVGLRVPSLTAFMTSKFSQGGVDSRSPWSQ